MSASGIERLTERECEVLALVAEGMRDAEIEEELGIAHPTVRAHISSIYKTLAAPPGPTARAFVAKVWKRHMRTLARKGA